MNGQEQMMDVIAEIQHFQLIKLLVKVNAVIFIHNTDAIQYTH